MVGEEVNEWRMDKEVDIVDIVEVLGSIWKIRFIQKWIEIERHDLGICGDIQWKQYTDMNICVGE